RALGPRRPPGQFLAPGAEGHEGQLRRGRAPGPGRLHRRGDTAPFRLRPLRGQPRGVPGLRREAQAGVPGAVGMPEAILEPDLPICDPHHHLWDFPPSPPPPPPLLAPAPTPPPAPPTPLP